MGDKPKPYVLVPQANWKLPTLSAPAEKSSQAVEQAPSRKRTLSTVCVEVPTASYAGGKRRRTSTLPSSPAVYTRAQGEINETQDLEVYGETKDDDEDADEDPEVPVRLLSNFTIYNRETLELVPAVELERHDLETLGLTASGIVKPWVEDDDDEDEGDSDVESLDLESYDDWKCVSLTDIIEFNVHHVDEAAAELDPKIYIRTKHAWYILEDPSKKYRDYFKALWARCRLVHVFLKTAQSNFKLLYPEFQEDINKYDGKVDGLVSTFSILRRQFAPQDLDENNIYLLARVDDLAGPLKVARSALVRAVRGTPTNASAPPSRSRSQSSSYVHSKASSSASQRTPGKGKKKDAEIVIYTTPTVSRLGEGLFQVPMKRLKSSHSGIEDDADRPTPSRATQHPYDPKKVEWDTHLQDGVYRDVYIDGVHYEAGDIVMVVPDQGYKGPNNHGYTTNHYGNAYWFCRIWYFYEEEKKGVPVKQFHGQWLLHGSRTAVLGELAHPGSLFVIDSCSSQPVSCIFQKCNMRVVTPGEDEPAENLDPYANDFHCSSFYDEETTAITDIPDEYTNPLFGNDYCHACWQSTKHAQRSVPRITSAGLEYLGVTYHTNDFVYLVPKTGGDLLHIAQITEIKKVAKGPSISVRYLKRHVEAQLPFNEETVAEAPPTDIFYDERKLFFTRKYAKADPLHLSGICYVRHLIDEEKVEPWVRHHDHFYVHEEEDDGMTVQELPRKSFAYCKPCRRQRETQVAEEEAFAANQRKIISMELFAGAGGLGLGMDLSGHVQTDYAVEFVGSAACTYQKNHPNAKVYCQDTNLLLKHAVARDNGENPDPLVSLCPDIPCPKMPSKNDGIDFILGGPPCQGFSGMNHNKRDDDVRTSMPCNMLGFVEHYNPEYFMLENVKGLLNFKLRDSREGRHGETIKWGMLKFVTRILIALGYQTRWQQLQSAEYGVPQSRGRVIIWGAKRGSTLPNFPVPTHAFGKAARPMIPSTKTNLPPPTRSLIGGNTYHQCAPHQPRSIMDAIADLPPFDWANPYPEKLSLGGPRYWFGKEIMAVDALPYDPNSEEPDVGVAGGLKARRYTTAPLNRYQKWLRQGSTEPTHKQQRVELHYTPVFHADVVYKTLYIPLEPNVHSTSLPRDLWPKGARKAEEGDGKKHYFYGRADGNGYFRCILTTHSPQTKGSWALHPLQRRIYTVRELARAQGFPDDYVFLSPKTRCPPRLKIKSNKSVTRLLFLSHSPLEKSLVQHALPTGARPSVNRVPPSRLSWTDHVVLLDVCMYDLLYIFISL
ncbi:S-adenosyl-L-methionine-dependent methyltransferase [Coprinopsis sp. MPI-PUGE-AT-0042]|nr:S-adenosyl-L-methionine-dependent methyltransferase [Coprinopsis sp. MPI-PUGE-AT-0042]